MTRNVVTDWAGTSTRAARSRTATGAPRRSAPSALVTTGVTVAFAATTPNADRSSATVRAAAPSLTCTTVARPPGATAATLEVSATATSRSPGRMWWVKLRTVSNLVFVWIGQVRRVSAAVQSNGSWMLPQLAPCGNSPPGFMLS
ncbi:hypothetical protein [Micromonospora carbonacea]|uniref:hypothetical protein n=1 Tax=Micromonospora carbonacea TaxID=47853 RepID=UPI0018075E5E|nr:hypothetical protein [Micromonospora carbonacea]MBB5827148.1 hypothetical protein [Micromonospora carbonacea]